MDLIHGLADFCNLTGGPRLFFELLITLIGRFFITDRVRFFFVNGLFFERSCGGKGRGLKLRRSGRSNPWG